MLQKKIIRIIIGCRSSDSCGELFKILKILPLQSQYILPLLLFVISNKDQYKVNSVIHSTNTRQSSNLYQPLSNLTTYQKRTYHFGIKVFSNLPSHIKNLSHNMEQFKSVLKSFKHPNSFLSLGEHFNGNKD
jgi:hypothetical protein